MDVILGVDQFPSLTKDEINQGQTSQELMRIADFLRSTFLLSNSFIHDNNFVLFCRNQSQGFPKGLIILFKGVKLRYLAPDERGILFLLLKIDKIINGKGGKKRERREYNKFRSESIAQSTPGIYVQNGNWGDIWNIYFPSDSKYVFFDDNPYATHRLDSFEELFEILTPQIILVFSKNPIIPVEHTSFVFVNQSWKAKFYESELITYIQAKITK